MTRHQMRTGWPPSLLQDDCRQLSGWLASRACATCWRQAATNNHNEEPTMIPFDLLIECPPEDAVTHSVFAAVTQELVRAAGFLETGRHERDHIDDRDWLRLRLCTDPMMPAAADVTQALRGIGRDLELNQMTGRINLETGRREVRIFKAEAMEAATR